MDLASEKQVIEQTLQSYLRPDSEWSKRIWDAMAYSLMAGGKRIRPLMVALAYQACGGQDIRVIRPYQAAIEMVHTYSLIHDDLPAMDNDDYRRGRLTNHKAFDEATAILAGDGLLNLGLEIAIANAVDERSRRAALVLAQNAGPSGMVAGQMADLIYETKTADEAALCYIEQKKTGCLFLAALLMGAALAGADDRQTDALRKAAAAFGRAFQIQDDILDVEGDAKLLGKSVGKDAKDEKVTFVTVYGLDEAKQKVHALFCEVADALSVFEDHQLSDWLLSMVGRQF